MSLVERVGLIEGALVEQTRILPAKHARAEMAPDAVVELVAGDGGERQQADRPGQLQGAGAAQCTGHEQQ